MSEQLPAVEDYEHNHLPFEEDANGRVELDPMAAIEAAKAEGDARRQAEAEAEEQRRAEAEARARMAEAMKLLADRREQERQRQENERQHQVGRRERVRQSVEGFLGDLENIDPDTAASFQEYLSQRPAGPEEDTRTSAGTYKTVEEHQLDSLNLSPSFRQEYDETMPQNERGGRTVHELINDWAEASAANDRTLSNDIQEELQGRIDALTHADPREKQRMMAAQTAAMERARDRYQVQLLNATAEELGAMSDNERSLHEQAREHYLRNITPAQMEALSEDEQELARAGVNEYLARDHEAEAEARRQAREHFDLLRELRDHDNDAFESALQELSADEQAAFAAYDGRLEARRQAEQQRADLAALAAANQARVPSPSAESDDDRLARYASLRDLRNSDPDAYRAQLDALDEADRDAFDEYNWNQTRAEFEAQQAARRAQAPAPANAPAPTGDDDPFNLTTFDPAQVAPQPVAPVRQPLQPPARRRAPLFGGDVDYNGAPGVPAAAQVPESVRRNSDTGFVPVVPLTPGEQRAAERAALPLSTRAADTIARDWQGVSREGESFENSRPQGTKKVLGGIGKGAKWVFTGKWLPKRRARTEAAPDEYPNNFLDDEEEPEQLPAAPAPRRPVPPSARRRPAPSRTGDGGFIDDL